MSAGNCSIASCVSVPVPPSPQGLCTNSKECRFSRTVHTSSGLKSDCGWAFKVSEVQRACSLAHVCTSTKPKFCRIKTTIEAITQNGPTCGLTALNMLTNGSPSTNDILVMAKRKQFTNHGEMFCNKHLKELAIEVFNSINYPISIECYSGQLNCDHIKTELRDGACLLVAYPFSFQINLHIYFSICSCMRACCQSSLANLMVFHITFLSE